MGVAEAARFPEVAKYSQSLAWSPPVRAVMDLLAHHAEQGTVVVDDLELAAEQFLALVAVMPARLAAFGIARPPEVEERHLQHAVSLFLHGVLAR
jgi:AefR-like transcriptional repressor, C-terminal domain